MGNRRPQCWRLLRPYCSRTELNRQRMALLTVQKILFPDQHGSFQKLGTPFWASYNKSPTLWGSISVSGPLIFGNSHIQGPDLIIQPQALGHLSGAQASMSHSPPWPRLFGCRSSHPPVSTYAQLITQLTAQFRSDFQTRCGHQEELELPEDYYSLSHKDPGTTG